MRGLAVDEDGGGGGIECRPVTVPLLERVRLNGSILDWIVYEDVVCSLYTG